MRRLLLAVVIAAVAVAAWSLPEPDVESTGSEALPDPRPLSARSGVWYCAGAEAETDPVLGAALPVAARAEFSLPVAGEFIDAFERRLTSPGVAQVDVGNWLRFHPGPALVEVSSSPSGAAVLLAGPSQLAGDSCQIAAKEWFLAGGTQGPAERLTLRLYNPLLEPARASLQLMSEFGFEPLLGDAQVQVAPRDWEDFDFGPLLGERERVAIKVSTAEGVVIPSFASSGQEGLAVWSGEGLSPRWEFPVVQADGTAATLSLWNPGAVETTATVSIHGTTGLIETITLTVGSQREERVDIAAISAGDVAALIDSDLPLAAAVLTNGPSGRAGTVGAPRTLNQWLVPANNLIEALRYRVVVFNSSDSEVEVVSRSVGNETANRVTMPPGAIRRQVIVGKGAEITTSAPVSVGWIAEGAGDVAIGLATPVPELAP